MARPGCTTTAPAPAVLLEQRLAEPDARPAADGHPRDQSIHGRSALAFISINRRRELRERGLTEVRAFVFAPPAVTKPSLALHFVLPAEIDATDAFRQLLAEERHCAEWEQLVASNFDTSTSAFGATVTPYLPPSLASNVCPTVASSFALMVSSVITPMAISFFEPINSSFAMPPKTSLRNPQKRELVRP